MKVNDDDFGLLSYDPVFTATACCRSAITFIDGDKGILRYRGYPIDQLAERSSFLEVTYLLLNGELPSREQLDQFTHTITDHTFVHENVKKFIACRATGSGSSGTAAANKTDVTAPVTVLHCHGR